MFEAITVQVLLSLLSTPTSYIHTYIANTTYTHNTHTHTCTYISTHTVPFLPVEVISEASPKIVVQVYITALGNLVSSNHHVDILAELVCNVKTYMPKCKHMSTYVCTYV